MAEGQHNREMFTFVHAVASSIGRITKPLGAASATFFVAHEHSPGDLRIVFEHKLLHPETEYGILSRSTVRRYLAEVDPAADEHVASYDTAEGDPHHSALSRRFVAREQFKTSIQKLWMSGGLPIAMLFINFRHRPDASLLRNPELRENRLQEYEALLKATLAYQRSAAAKTVANLTADAEALGMKLYFGLTDFERMNRGGRDSVLEQLVRDVLSAHIGEQNCWWSLYVPGSHPDTLVRIRAFGDESARTPDKIIISDHSYLESLVYSWDCAIRIVRPTESFAKPLFAQLLGTKSLMLNGGGTKAIVSVPITAGHDIFAVATFGVHAGAKIRAASMTNALRSLWLNGRGISQYLRQSLAERVLRFGS